MNKKKWKAIAMLGGSLIVAGAGVGCLGTDGATSSTPNLSGMNSVSARAVSDSISKDTNVVKIRHDIDSVLALERHLLDSVMMADGQDSAWAARREKMDSLMALRKAKRDSVLAILMHDRDSILAMDSTKWDSLGVGGRFRGDHFHGGRFDRW